MNKGYSYSVKVIKNKDVTDKEYATISSNLEKLHGVGVKLDWDRYYPYGDVFKSILLTITLPYLSYIYPLGDVSPYIIFSLKSTYFSV